jgi:hypothetical protein
MNQEINKLVNQYINWLKDKTVIKQINDYAEITTPYLDRHNDYLQIYAKKADGKFVLSDDGYVINDLKSSGCNLTGKKRQDLLNLTLNGFGVKLVGNVLTVEADATNFPLKKHNLVQAILSVNDLFYLAEPVTSSLFFENVESWLNGSDVRYTPNVKFTGKSGFDHQFEFVIPKSKVRPERMLHTMNSISRATAEKLAFSWFDTKSTHSPDATAYALVNDTKKAPQESVLEALKNYEVQPILWSQRESIVRDLVA